MLKKYDFLCSVGNFCLSSQVLRKNALQYESFPLDWMMFDDFEGVLKMLEANFADLVNHQYLERVKEGERHDSYRNSLYGVVLHHDFRQDYAFEENLRIVKNRYHRRIERLAERINAAKTILAVHCEENSTIDNEKLKQQFKRLQNLWQGKHLDMIFLSIDDRISESRIEQIGEHICKAHIAVAKERKYDDMIVAALPYMKEFDTSFKVKMMQVLRSTVVYIRKPILKLVATLPMPKKYKTHIKMLYKDKFRA